MQKSFILLILILSMIAISMSVSVEAADPCKLIYEPREKSVTRQDCNKCGQGRYTYSYMCQTGTTTVRTQESCYAGTTSTCAGYGTCTSNGLSCAHTRERGFHCWWVSHSYSCCTSWQTFYTYKTCYGTQQVPVYGTCSGIDCCVCGTCTFSEVYYERTQKCPPGTPSISGPSKATLGETVTFSWSSSGATYFNGQTSWISPGNMGSITGTSFVIEQDVPLGQQSVSVQACNDIGCSDWATNSISIEEAVSAPTSAWLTLIPSEVKGDECFGANYGANSKSPVSFSYTYSNSPEYPLDTSGATGCVVTPDELGFEPGSYTFTLKAENTAGAKYASTTLTVKEKISKPFFPWKVANLN